MNRLWLPITVSPVPVTVPRCRVANSRTWLPSPRRSQVCSPAYLRSWGGAPTEANWKMRLSRPISVQLSMTACAPIVVPAPIVTPSPMTT